MRALLSARLMQVEPDRLLIQGGAGSYASMLFPVLSSAVTGRAGPESPALHNRLARADEFFHLFGGITGHPLKGS
jgi:hypothetical protein